MDFCSTPCVFLGYSPSHHGYRCLDISTERLYIARHWHQAMTEEYDALIKNGTWSLVPRASNTNVVDCVDFHKTFSPVVKSTSLMVTNNWPLRHLDVQNAFLLGNIKERASRAWFERLSKALYDLGFKGSKMEPSLFIYLREHTLLYTLVYVDDIIVTELLQRASLSNCNPVSSPMVTSSTLSLDDSTAFSNLVKYRQNHWSAVKQILCYVYGTDDHGMLIHHSSGSTLQAFTNVLWKGSPNASLEAFSDAD
ncbi:retrovirus-related pol polyprotein from transposon TNT 1-94 [Tanacetum coccineum]